VLEKYHQRKAWSMWNIDGSEGFEVLSKGIKMLTPAESIQTCCRVSAQEMPLWKAWVISKIDTPKAEEVSSKSRIVRNAV
jgi:hypothetical protein